MAFVYTWTESTPAAGDPANQLHTNIHNTIKMIRERFDVEHEAANGNDADTYVHSADSARINYGLAAARAAAASANDYKVYLATDTGVFSYSNGSTWVDIFDPTGAAIILTDSSLGNALDANGQKITNLADATINGDALRYQHKSAATLDHPASSVTTAKIADDAVDADKLKDAVVVFGHLAASSGIAQVKLGTYLGNGTTPHSIDASIDLSSSSWIILVYPKESTGSGNQWVLASSSNASGESFIDGSNPQTDCILSVDSDGFNVGDNNDVNKNGITYIYIILKLA